MNNSLQEMSVADRLRRVGSPDQLYGVTRVTVDEGKARGAALYQVKTGGGLCYDVTADNGLDIGCLSYRGVNIRFLTKNGYVSPYAATLLRRFSPHLPWQGCFIPAACCPQDPPTGIQTAFGSPSTAGITTSPPINASAG